jgi:asparagine synthase (glutamine-hydrolysing)
MCGIAGWYRRQREHVPKSVVMRQCDTLIQRGPDDSGVYVDGDFGFGMRRLSIIDVEGGHQPIFSADGRYAIVFNGEIYNHLDLRGELEKLGWSFRTRSDTETILAAFVEWGDEAWLRLDGMFAVAIWDRAKRTLTLARDPLGIKPLYITEQNGGLAFASDIRALRVLPEHHWDVDARAVHDFFSFGYVQPPGSIYSQVRSLGPGTYLHVGPADIVEKTYWQPHFRVNDRLSEAEWIEETRARVKASVKAHMLADVPIGAFLSGGVDSTAIAAAMAQLASAPVKAFTLGFPGTSIDESSAASRIAKKLGVDHLVLPLEPLHAGDVLPQVQADFDEPCAATAALPLWHLSRFAREHVKVVLCGEGADEILAGYKRQRTALLASKLAPLLKGPFPFGRIIDALPSSKSVAWNYQVQNMRRFRSEALLDNNLQRYIAATQISTPAVRARLFEPEFWEEGDERSSLARLEAEFFRPEDRSLRPLEQLMLGDLTIHMPSSLLMRLDRASMAHSLEGRVPFLSRDFVDWSLTMPLKMKLRGRVGKYALRQAIAPWLGDSAPSPQKLGFQLPFAEWFRGDFSRFAREAWADSGAREAGYLRQDSVQQLFAEHDAGVANHGRLLFAIAMFGCWWQQNVAQSQTRAA